MEDHDGRLVPVTPLWRRGSYQAYLLAVAGLGGLLYGIDIGVISQALLYLNKTVDLTQQQTSAIVAAVLGGSMVSSLLAGVLADLMGRKLMLIGSGLLFVASVLLIVSSQGFPTLFAGRLLQGLSGGVIAVVIPLYLAETLSPDARGRGSAIFQFMLTFGIVTASLVGLAYVHGADTAIAAAQGNPQLIRAAENHAWRGMYLAVVYPGLLYLAGTLFLSESPRWLFLRGRTEKGLKALRRLSPRTDPAEQQLLLSNQAAVSKSGGEPSLLSRRYVFPFLLACVILICNQTTGINSILAYLSLILRHAGMSAERAAQGDLLVKALNCAMTLVAIPLIDRKGRKPLLAVGTGGVIVALLMTGAILHRFDSQRIDVLPQVQTWIHEGRTGIQPSDLATLHQPASSHAALQVLYRKNGGEHLLSLFSDDTVSLNLPASGDAEVIRASLLPMPSARAAWAITTGLALFIVFFSIGPGVVVWLALSELMPTRIRSTGMGLALLLNQGASTLIAGVFLPVVTARGYSTMFFGWAACTVVYFLTVVIFLPETKGKPLEEIEAIFAAGSATHQP